MMLLSRVVFQAAGPTWMRAFLDGWQHGRVKRLWGGLAICFAAFLIATGARRIGALAGPETILLLLLVVVLLVDGLVNVLPAGFETFKTRMQDAWVARRRGTGREGDRYLFGTVNAILAAGAAVAASAVVLYRPIEGWIVAAAAGASVVLTLALIGLSVVESARRTPGSRRPSLG